MNDNTKIDIEMQIRPQKFWIKRQLYYLTRAYSDDLGMGQSYDRLKKCIIISILDFNLSDDAEYHSRYTLMDSNNREHTDLLEVHVIELRKTVFCNHFLYKVAKSFCRSLHLHFVGNCKGTCQAFRPDRNALQTLFNCYSTRYGNGSSEFSSSCACSLKYWKSSSSFW